MATYCYSRGEETIEKFIQTGRAPAYITHDGKKYYRDYSAESVSVPSTAWANPIHCVASGVAPSQANELRDLYRRNGLNVRVDNDGNPIYTSKAEREKALKLRGLHDRNSYF